MTWQEFEAAKGIKMGIKLRGIYKKFVPKKYTVEQFTELMEANSKMIRAICDGTFHAKS
jgi:hypothetical protein